MREPVWVPYCNIVENASIGDFLLAITARLETIIEKTAAANGAAIAKPTLLGDNFPVINLLMLHPSLLNQAVLEWCLLDQVRRLSSRAT